MIAADNIWKKFVRHEALRGLSFSVPEGSAYALIGANGAGKTTTIRILLNILEPERGRATVLGVDSRRISPRELSQIGYVSENQDMPSHELSEIEGVASHVAFLDEGKLLFKETMSDLTARFREVRVTLDRAASPPGRAPAEWLNVRT
jgi:ABC-2 type transport system ATP-binding protein